MSFIARCVRKAAEVLRRMTDRNDVRLIAAFLATAFTYDVLNVLSKHFPQLTVPPWLIVAGLVAAGGAALLHRWLFPARAEEDDDGQHTD